MVAALRPRLRFFVAVWLVFHVTASVLVARAIVPDSCTCPAGMTPGQTCPMHHSETSTARCRLINAQDSSSLFSSVFALVGLPPEPTVCADALIPLSLIGATSFILIQQSDTPDSPPPRA